MFSRWWLLFTALVVVPAASGAPRAFVLAIGLDRVNPAADAYLGWAGRLDSCERDATFYAGLLADDPGVTKTLLVNERATRAAVMGQLNAFAHAAVAGDLVLVAFSGHGTQVRDTNGDERQIQSDDRFDEAWCLYDDLLIDDELYAIWSDFQPGVEILVVSDSCHSATTVKAAGFVLDDGSGFLAAVEPSRLAVKAMPPAHQASLERKHGAEYAARQQSLKGGQTDVAAAVFLFAACLDDQQAVSIRGQLSLYTGTLQAVWSDGAFRGSAVELTHAIAAALPDELRSMHTPQYFLLGRDAAALAAKRPFTLPR